MSHLSRFWSTWAARFLNVLANRSKYSLYSKQISVLIQRFNTVLFHETFPVEDDTDM